MSREYLQNLERRIAEARARHIRTEPMISTGDDAEVTFTDKDLDHVGTVSCIVGLWFCMLGIMWAMIPTSGTPVHPMDGWLADAQGSIFLTLFLALVLFTLGATVSIRTLSIPSALIGFLFLLNSFGNTMDAREAFVARTAKEMAAHLEAETRKQVARERFDTYLHDLPVDKCGYALREYANALLTTGVHSRNTKVDPLASSLLRLEHMECAPADTAALDAKYRDLRDVLNGKVPPVAGDDLHGG